MQALQLYVQRDRSYETPEEATAAVSAALDALAACARTKQIWFRWGTACHLPEPAVLEAMVVGGPFVEGLRIPTPTSKARLLTGDDTDDIGSLALFVRSLAPGAHAPGFKLVATLRSDAFDLRADALVRLLQSCEAAAVPDRACIGPSGVVDGRVGWMSLASRVDRSKLSASQVVLPATSGVLVLAHGLDPWELENGAMAAVAVVREALVAAPTVLPSVPPTSPAPPLAPARYMPAPEPLTTVDASRSYATWDMDRVVMAPFCAHDCFHAHWRWADNVNGLKSTFGFDGMIPNAVEGAPMVPRNQVASLFVDSAVEFTYMATATEIDAHVWQPFFHHGAAYGTSAGVKTTLARQDVAAFTTTKIIDVDKVGSGTSPTILDSIDGDCALCFWRNRFRLVEKGGRLVPQERFRFLAGRKRDALDS